MPSLLHPGSRATALIAASALGGAALLGLARWPDIEFELGYAYEAGNFHGWTPGFTQDYRSAARWLNRAAAANHPRAQYRLGILHTHGWGVPKDDNRAGEWLTDLRIYDKTKSGLDREIRAARGRVSRQEYNLLLDLYDTTIDPLDDEHPGAAHAARFSHEITGAFLPASRPKKIRTSGAGELRRMLPEAVLLRADPAQADGIVGACPDCARRTTKGKPSCRNPVHETARVLQNAAGLYDPALVSRLKATCQACRTKSCNDPNHARILLAASAYQRSQSFPAEIRMELNKRFALASAAFCFALIGMPLGIRSHRRESTIGVAIGLGIALLYYMAMILADAFKQSPGWHPEILAWLPAILCVVVAAVLIPRNQ